MKPTIFMAGLTAILLAGCAAQPPRAGAESGPARLVIRATRAETPPTIDGKLDDACWKAARPVTDFITYRTDRASTVGTCAYVCYDNTNLYIAMRCSIPRGKKPVGEWRPHDTYLFSDDAVEIFIDPGERREHYYQLAINAYGATFDTRREKGGGHDPTWDGDWTGAASIGDDYWSAEIAVPFGNLGIEPGVGSTWGINLCRDDRSVQDELSSTGVRGAFTEVDAFARLVGLDVDFSRYHFKIGPGVVRLGFAAGQRRAEFAVPVTNLTGAERLVRLERRYLGADDSEKVESTTVRLAPGASAATSAEWLDLQPLMEGRSDAYVIRSAPRTTRIRVVDAESGASLASAKVQRPWFLEALRVETEDPWRRDMGAEKTPVVAVKIRSDVSAPLRESASLRVALISRADGSTVDSRELSAPPGVVEVRFPTQNVPWGAYDVRAVLQDGDGREIAASSDVATVLPGGAYRVKVLNNMVSELMNVAERGLLGEETVPFMNPRDGWVFFSVTGPARVRLDSEDEPLLVASGDGKAVEAMRLLSVGRHELRIDGDPRQVIVRAIPELIYSCYPGTAPRGRKLGKASGREAWEYLKENILPHCTTILGDTSDAAAMREWVVEKHRRWITFGMAPGHGLGGETFYKADEYYRQLLRHEGMTNPLASGVILDQFGACSVEQKTEIALAMARIAANPELKGRAYQPWYEGSIYGSEGDLACMKVLLEAGWPFSFYVYLTEQRTAEQVMDDIENTIVRQARYAEETIPGSLRRAVVTLGYWSDLPSGQLQDIDPGANFKILMQMQMEALAEHPSLFGVYGLFWYYSPYVDEEILRWTARLHRYYGIEGGTGPLSRDPYRLPHIRNADFEDGTAGWTVREAEPGSVWTGRHPGYGHLQGRYLGGSRGDTFLVTRRSAKGPNSFSQEVRGLIPGRVYSLKMITADHRNIIEERSVEARDAVSVRLDGVEDFEPHGREAQTTYPNHYGHLLGKFRGDHHAYMNAHWYLFRAKDETALLTISDWASPDDPGGPIGQEIMYNFIQIEPYFEEGGETR